MRSAKQAQDGSVVNKSEYCRNHPFVKPNWRCVDCGREFCEKCVTPIRHLTSERNRTAVCPECKGRCIDSHHIENQTKVELEEKRKKLFKVLRATIIAIFLFTTFLLLAPIELKIPVLLIIIIAAAVIYPKMPWRVGPSDWLGIDKTIIDTDELIPPRRRRVIITILAIALILAFLFLLQQQSKYGFRLF